MSRITTQALPVDSPDQLGALAPQPTSRQVFASSVGVDDTASQLLGVLQSAGQAVAAYGQLQQRRSQEELQDSLTSARGELQEELNIYLAKNPNDKDFGEFASASKSRVQEIIDRRSSEFKGTDAEAMFLQSANSVFGRVSDGAHSYEKRVADLAQSAAKDEAILSVFQSRTEMPTEVYSEFRESFLDPDTRADTYDDVRNYFYDTLTDPQKRAYDDPESELGRDLRTYIEAQVRQVVSPFKNEVETNRKAADQQLEELNIQGTVNRFFTSLENGVEVLIDSDVTLTNKRVQEAVDQARNLAMVSHGFGREQIQENIHKVNELLTSPLLGTLNESQRTTLQRSAESMYQTLADKTIATFERPEHTGSKEAGLAVLQSNREAVIQSLMPLLSDEEQKQVSGPDAWSEINKIQRLSPYLDRYRAEWEDTFVRLSSDTHRDDKITKIIRDLTPGTQSSFSVDTTPTFQARSDPGTMAAVYQDRSFLQLVNNADPELASIMQAAGQEYNTLFEQGEYTDAMAAIREASEQYDARFRTPGQKVQMFTDGLRQDDISFFETSVRNIERMGVNERFAFATQAVSQRKLTGPEAMAMIDMLNLPESTIEDKYAYYQERRSMYGGALQIPDSESRSKKTKWAEGFAEVETDQGVRQLSETAKHLMSVTPFAAGLDDSRDITQSRRGFLLERGYIEIESQETGELHYVFDPAQRTLSGRGFSIAKVNENLSDDSSEHAKALVSQINQQVDEVFKVGSLSSFIVDQYQAAYTKAKNAGQVVGDVPQDAAIRKAIGSTIVPMVQERYSSTSEPVTVFIIRDKERNAIIGQPVFLNSSQFENNFGEFQQQEAERQEQLRQQEALSVDVI